MKKFFRLTGWILFTFITILLIQEYNGIPIYDTCLFSLGGQSVGFQGADVYDLSPLLMGAIYLAVLIVNGISIKNKNDYMVTNLSNFVLSIPIFLVLSYFALSYPYPPFGIDEMTVIPIYTFLIYVYLSWVVLVVLGIWALLHKIRKKA